MCEPISMILGVLGMAGSLMAPKPPDPPKPEMPAIAAPVSKTPGATVRLGNGQDDITNTNSNEPTMNGGFTERRVSGNSLGNLGKSGLAL